MLNKSTLTILCLLLLSVEMSAQYVQGMNYIKLGGVQFNQENKERDMHLPLQVYTYIDSTHTDTTIYKGNSTSDLTFSYHVAVTDFLVLGITSRFLQSKESSYIIKSGGFSIRYAFPLKLVRKPPSNFVLSKDERVVRNFFFLDYSGLFGKLHYDQFISSYTSHILQFGISLRVPTADTKMVRHLGLEISGGVNYRSQPYQQNGIFPYAAAGIQYYFDRKYTKVIDAKKD